MNELAKGGKDGLPYEVLQMMEWVLRQYPGRKRDLRLIDDLIEERAHAFSLEAVGSGTSVSLPRSAQERIVEYKEGHRRYQWLKRFLDRTGKAMTGLTELERQYVERHYWDGMRTPDVAEELNLNRTSVYRLRLRVLRKLAASVLDEWVYMS
jgi:DNA-directed RNA polymerase specialized sigma24 family protein